MKLVVYGGSNSFMNGGYAHRLPAALAAEGCEASLQNLAMGNTFVHFGLYQAASKKAHVDAEVVILEFAINDQELLNHGVPEIWRAGFEGLVRKVTREAPGARLVTVILYQERFYTARRSGGRWPLAEWMRAVTHHYDGAVLDTAEAFEQRFGTLPPESEVFRNASHYAPAFQAQVAADLSALITTLQPRPAAELPPLLSPIDYSDVRTLGLETIGTAAPHLRRVSLRNSRTEVEALQMTQGQTVEFDLHGELVVLVYASTPADGIVVIDSAASRVCLSAYRRAYLEATTEKHWPYLLSNLLPALVTKSLFEASGALRIELLTAEQAEGVQPFLRGSTAEPPSRDGRTFNLIDIVYRGQLTPA